MGTPEFIRTATLTLWDNGADTMAIATALGIKEHIAAYIIHCEQDVARGACSYGPLAGV